MTRRFVLDASVVAKCLWPEEDSYQAMEVYNTLAHDLIAPDFLLYEITNAMWKKVRRAHIHINDAETILKEFNHTLRVRMFSKEQYLDAAFKLAQKLNHNSIYDCIYIALAEDQNCLLITADMILLENLNRAGLSHLATTLAKISIH